jgi:hypothetical protein
MMNRNGTTTLLAIVGIALLSTVMIMPSPTRVLGHLDQDFTPYTGFAKVSLDASGPAFNINGEEKDSNEDSTTATTDEDERAGSDEVTKSEDQDSSQADYEELQTCLSGVEGQGSPTEEEAIDCMEAGYGGIDNNENAPTESTDDSDEDKNGVTEAIDDAPQDEDDEE